MKAKGRRKKLKEQEGYAGVVAGGLQEDALWRMVELTAYGGGGGLK